MSYFESKQSVHFENREQPETFDIVAFALGGTQGARPASEMPGMGESDP